MNVLYLINEDANGNFSLDVGGQVTFLKVSPYLDLQQYNLIIIPRGLKVTLANPDSPDGIAERKAFLARINFALKKGIHLCVILDTYEIESDYLLSDLINNKVKTIQASSEKLISEITDIQDLVDVYGRPNIAFDIGSNHQQNFVSVITAEDPDWRVHGLCDISREGNFYLLPVFPIKGDEKRFVEALVSSIMAHLTRLELGGAPIIDYFVFSKEDKLRKKCDGIKRELEKTEDKLEDYAKRKSILYLTGKQLENELPLWLERNLGLKTRRVEEYIEDFWLRDLEDKEDVAIGEVKAIKQNVRRKHISALVLHREEREREEGFPSILIVNTFSDAVTVSSKDKVGISPKEVGWAVKSNVLVIRTLDLVRLADLYELNKLTTEQVLYNLIENNGWLRVKMNLEIKLVGN